MPNALDLLLEVCGRAGAARSTSAEFPEDPRTIGLSANLRRAYRCLLPVELGRAEETMEIELPQILKDLYLVIGNGGFGPGPGLLPLTRDGISTRSTFNVVELYMEWNRPRITIQNKALPTLQDPERFLPIVDWHSGRFSMMAPYSPSCHAPVVRFEPNIAEDEELTRRLAGNGYWRGAGFIPERLRLVQWLVDWLKGRNIGADPYDVLSDRP